MISVILALYAGKYFGFLCIGLAPEIFASVCFQQQSEPLCFGQFWPFCSLCINWMQPTFQMQLVLPAFTASAWRYFGSGEAVRIQCVRPIADGEAAREGFILSLAR